MVLVLKMFVDNTAIKIAAAEMNATDHIIPEKCFIVETTSGYNPPTKWGDRLWKEIGFDKN